MAPDGVVVVDKPPGMTSHDVVDRVRRIFGTKKVGHAGTLDPDATGVLVLGVGQGTRLLSFAQEGPKRYLTTASFGTTTSTQDASGEVLETRPVALDMGQVESAAAKFVGDIEQIPPMVSAVKVGGERLYRKARRGEEVERPARPVTIHSLQVTGFRADPPEADLDISCSPGTYIRTLVHDLGEALGCGAHLKTLRRVSSSGFEESDATVLDALGPDHLRPLDDLVRALPRLNIDGDATALVRDGRALANTADDVPEEQPLALFFQDRLLAIYKRRGDRLVADKVIAS
jgi:tRNA pseudouridine55 synthase